MARRSKRSNRSRPSQRNHVRPSELHPKPDQRPPGGGKGWHKLIDWALVIGKAWVLLSEIVTTTPLA